MQRLVPARLLAALRPDSSARLELPPDIVREARGRVHVAAALGALAYVVFLVAALSGADPQRVSGRAIDLTHDALGAGLCAVLLVLTLLPALSDRVVLRAALVIECLLSALISIAVPWTAFLRTGHVPGLTWVVPIVILFALLVPTPPRTMLGVSLLCALTMPAGVAILAANGLVVAHAPDLVAIALTGLVGAGMATVAARTVHRAGRQIAAARTIGSYELVDRIGEGGMGEVWRARHLMLARPAAVKLILPEQLFGESEKREAAIERFRREAEITASLCSPHTVELYDFGVSAEGRLYYAMELLDGLTAEHFVYRFGPLEPRRAVRWLVQVCHSLGEAHARGLVHRDIKPSNLFVCHYGRDADFVKVLDFGLGRQVAAPADGELTQPGARLGSPGFMAPEQVFGLASGPRTDLYALGCVGYFLLAGAKPFDAPSAGELMRLHAQAPPPPLAGRTPQPVPAGVEATIMACLAKDPQDRPADADHLSAALVAALGAEPWSQSEADAWWGEHLANAAT